MKPEKVWAALELYDRELEEAGYPVKQFEQLEYDIAGQMPKANELAHCRWMARMCTGGMRREYEDNMVELLRKIDTYRGEEVVEQVAEARKPLEKAMRWLGCIQGVCKAHGVYSYTQMRDHSRGGAGEFQTPAEEHGNPPPPQGVHQVFAGTNAAFQAHEARARAYRDEDRHDD